jgi:hypothetical protein
MGNTVFVVKNQQGLYLSKQQEWVDGTDNHPLYRTRHRDEAINTVFEVSSRDIYLRAETVICELDTKGNPALATAEAVTPARAAQIARQQNEDIEDEPTAVEETAPEGAEPEAESTDAPDIDPAVAADSSDTAEDPETAEDPTSAPT